MRAVFDDFEERVDEIDEFLVMLRLIEKPGGSLTYQTNRGERSRAISGNWSTTLKASTFLLLYNLMESALRRGLGVLYERIRADGHTYDELITELRDLWVDQRYRGIAARSASGQTYQSVAQELIARVAKRVTMELDDRRLPVSGNLDAKQVRRVCELHGIPIATHYRAQGGAELENVRKQRNNLAHGNLSFAECGRNYTVDELDKIKRQVVVFMRSILRNIDKYMKAKSYAA